MRLLLTGATGNVGRAVLAALYAQDHPIDVFTATRTPERARELLPTYPNLHYRALDYERPETFSTALQDVDTVFWLRPPQLANVKQHFRPFVLAMKALGISRVLLLSVQGAERSRRIPHRKMERLLQRYGMDYIIVRPSYFMQNLTTTLYQDLREKRRIFLPAGKATFNWIDVENIGRAIALLLLHFDQHRQRVYTLTGSESLDFYQVAEVLNRVLTHPIHYRALNPISFYWKKRRQGFPHTQIMVLLRIHFLPRLQGKPQLSTDYHLITSDSPTTLLEFARRNQHLLDQKI